MVMQIIGWLVCCFVTIYIVVAGCLALFVGHMFGGRAGWYEGLIFVALIAFACGAAYGLHTFAPFTVALASR